MRIFGDQRLQLRNQLRVPAQLEIRLDPIFQRRHPQLLQPPDLRLRERLERELSERAAAPQIQRVVQDLGRALRIMRSKRLTPLSQQTLETTEVDVLRFDLE